MNDPLGTIGTKPQTITTTPESMNPSIDPITGTVITTGANVASGIFANIGARKRAKEAFERQKWLIADERKYNDPSAQMARLKAAGINPHMAYMKGTLNNVSSNSNAVQMAKTFQIQPEMATALALASNIRNINSQADKNYADVRLKDSQKDNVEQNTKYSEAQTLGQTINNEMLEIKKQFANTREWQELRNIEMQTSLTQQRIRNARSERAKTIAERDLINLKAEEQKAYNKYAEAITKEDLNNKKLNNDLLTIERDFAQQGINWRTDSLATRQMWMGLKKYGWDDYTIEALLLKEGAHYVITNVKDFIGLGSKARAVKTQAQSLSHKIQTESTRRQQHVDHVNRARNFIDGYNKTKDSW